MKHSESGIRGNWLTWDRRSQSWREYTAPLTEAETLEILFADRDRKCYERTTSVPIVVDAALTTAATWATRVCVMLAVSVIAVVLWEWMHGWR